MHNVIRFFNTMPKFRKPNDPTLRRHPDRWHDRRMDRHYFMEPFRIKNYCIIVRMQKISSIHKHVLKIQQILASHERNGLTHFLLHPP